MVLIYSLSVKMFLCTFMIFDATVGYKSPGALDNESGALALTDSKAYESPGYALSEQAAALGSNQRRVRRRIQSQYLLKISIFLLGYYDECSRGFSQCFAQARTYVESISDITM